MNRINKGLRIITSLGIFSLLIFSIFLFRTLKSAQAQTQEVHINSCQTLSQANTKYILDNDVTSSGTCFTITASGVTLDLNGHTITYDDFPNAGLPNPGFENGTGDVPSDWDLSKAPHAKRRPNYEHQMAGKWHLLFDENTTDGEEIVSPWTYLPANKQAMAYVLNAFPDWKYTDVFQSPKVPPTRKIVVEFEDGSIVYQTNFTEEWGFGFIIKPVVGRYRLHYIIEKVNDNAYKPVRIDQLDIRTTSYEEYVGEKIYGININKPYVTVKNGRIIQGRGGSSFSHSIYMTSDSKVDNVYSYTHGMVAENIHGPWAGNVEIMNSTFESNNPYVFRRADLEAAVDLTNAAGNRVHHNTINSGAGWGCITVTGGPNHLIYNNTCRTQTTITNHYAITTYATKYTKIFNNLIEASPGSGIEMAGGAGFDYSEIYNNTIKTNGIAPNLESPSMLSDAIRVNDYKQGTSNVSVHDNDIYITGGVDPYYLQNPANQGQGVRKILNGIMNVLSGDNNRFYNNKIVVNITDPDVIGSGIAVGNMKGSNSQVWYNNTIESNNKNIVFGGYAGDSINSLLKSNTLIKGTNIVGTYHTIFAYQLPQIKDVHFLDTKLINGASLENAYLATYNPYDFYVDWYLNLLVQDSALQPIQNANIEIKDSTGVVVFSGATDINGKINDIILNQYKRYGGSFGADPKGFEYRTPHTITISKSGHPTETKTLTMDSSKEMTVILDGQTTEPPIISNVVASVDQTNKTATITWQTDRAADSKVDYGLDTSYGSSKTDAAMATTHSLQITNLSSNIYHFRVISKDSAGKENVGIDHTFFLLGGALPGITLTKSVDKSSAQAGDTLTYTINYQNTTADQTFSNVKIEDPIPSGSSYVSGSATAGGSFDGVKVIWNLSSLAVGASGSVQFKVRVQ